MRATDARACPWRYSSAEKAADQRQVEMLRLKRVALSSLLGRKGNELRQVAVVRRHRVGGRVAIQADVVEKAAELFHAIQIFEGPFGRREFSIGTSAASCRSAARAAFA